MSKCPACGAELSYDVKDQSVVCPYCRSTFSPQELELKDKYSKEVETFEGKGYNCRQCGATLLTFDETAITFCSYCGSQSIIETNMVEINKPEYVIPFKKTKEECINEYKKILKKALFVPNYMKDEMTIEKFRGIFMPYAIFKTSFHGMTSNNGRRYSHRFGDYVYYDLFTIKAQVDADYEGMSYDVLSKFYDEYSGGIPFDFNEAIPFNKNYLIGFYADTKDVDPDIYDDNVEAVTSNDVSKQLSRKSEFSRYGCASPKVPMKVSDIKMGMFPVYFLAIKDKENKVHYAVINGQTGKVAADLPIDFKKYVIGTLILSVIIAVLLYMAPIILPKTVLIFSLIASTLGMIISNSQLNKVYIKEKKLEDEGYVFVNKSDQEVNDKDKVMVITNGVKKYEYKMPFKDKKKHLLLYLIPIIIGIIVLLSKVVDDEYYYITAIISFIIIIFSFKNLVKEYNLLASNKLPQLEKRGGEKNEK